MNTIIVVDDDRFLSKSVAELLRAEQFQVTEAANAAEALVAVVESPPDLMILDVGLPDEDGFAFCRRIRAKWTFPVIMLTSRTDTIDKVIGLEVGADDYLTKPFAPRELVARVRAHLRRIGEYGQPTSVGNVIEVGELTIDLDARRVAVRGATVELTDLEFRLLEYLIQNAGRALGRDQLFEHVWGYDEEFNTNSLEVIVYRLRTKLEKPLGQRLIRTVRGYGYRLQLEA